MTQVNEQGRRRRPSLADVASHAGVSQGAVSKVIRNAYGVSPAMQQRVQRAIDDLNYRPRTGARGMRGQTFTIAIGSEMPQLGNDFFTQVTTGAAHGLAGSGYQLIIAPALDGEGDKKVLDALVDRQVDGILAISLEVTPSYLDRLAEYVPMVLVGRHDRQINYDTVTNDDRAGVTSAMEHLLALGHREIAHLTVGSGPTRADSSTPHAIRQATYERCMLENELRPHVVFSDASENSAYIATRLLLDDRARRTTAIFAGNDTLAIGALRAVAERGLSAREVSVVGYDNIELASHPLVSLTTVDQYGVKIGATAIELLMDRIRETPTEPRHVELDPMLVIRNSSAQR
ncbi:LacI family transcriptional regulator [Frigoribacterium sp. PhB160]|uniref:LacI family DNA-binding transcriptional regulator n=1 Tax=Frigoribacterium sp. PhB160 TaxID=2485192 RepID=UPI000F4634BE|nr:LacI family DNA-binding transcriptional regulator [Frigoribacterium sp. PhB160]ROS61142.1 LacI family transcriptional regulator [Frigoribacterium sp. PhB160]